MYLISCEKKRKFHQEPFNWKVRSFKGKIGYEIKDTTVTYDYRHTYSPTLKREIKWRI